jgi:hypothetical protein
MSCDHFCYLSDCHSLLLSISSVLTHVSAAKQAKDSGDSQPEKKTRKKKDADAPKKPMGAFFWYQQARREPIKKEKPELGHKEVIKVSNQIT